MLKELILYDFCDTLVDFQTANEYVRFAVGKLGLKRSFSEYVRLSLNKFGLMPIMSRLHPGMSVNKALYLYRLKDYRYEVLDSIAYDFYKHNIKPHLIEPVISRLVKDVTDGKSVAVISGGYDIYLKYFVAEFNIHHLLCSELLFKNGIFTGKIIGNDCMGKEKVIRFFKRFPECTAVGSPTSVTLYSDSETDIPLFNICAKRIAVIEDGKNPDWVNTINAKVIRYHKS